MFRIDNQSPSSVRATLWAGLEPAVRRLLADAGYLVQPDDILVAQPALPVPVQMSSQVDERLLATVQQHDRALLRYQKGAVDPARLIAQIALAWPQNTMLVLLARRDDVYALADRIRAHVPGVETVTGRSPLARVGRFYVSTYHESVHLPQEIGTRDIVIVDAAEAVGRRPRWLLSFAHRARLYGLLPRDVVPAPYDRDCMAEMFGFVEIVIPRHGHQERRVKIEWQCITGGPLLRHHLGPVGLRRQGIWGHPVRNRHIVRLAKSASGNGGVVVLVDAIEHALAIADRLPGWPMLTGADVNTAGLSPRQVAVFENWQRYHNIAGATRDDSDQLIATAAGLRDMDLGRVDTIIRADGGCGLPPGLNDDSLLVADANTSPLIIVDFQDRHHSQLRRWSRQRREAYDARGWYEHGVDPVAARIWSFLASRPEVQE